MSPSDVGAVTRESAPPLTRSEWVDRRLRESILSGELRPGERLLTAALTERFSVSPSPLREALARLAGEGLVDISPQRGARVAPLSLRACRELHELLGVLEPYALGVALDRRNPTWEAEVASAAEAFDDAVSNGAAPADIESAFVALHLALLSGCPSAWMLRMVRMALENSGRYRIACLEHADRAPFVEDHRQLVAAAGGSNVKRANAALRRTIDRTVETIEKLAATGLIDLEDPMEEPV